MFYLQALVLIKNKCVGVCGRPVHFRKDEKAEEC